MKKALYSLLAAVVITAGFASSGYADEVYGVMQSRFTDILSGSGSSGFDMTRARLGYRIKPSDDLSASILFDFVHLDSVSFDASGNAKAKDQRSTGYLIVGYGEWKSPIPATSIRFGLIPMLINAIDEPFWGNRFIYKSFLDQYGIAPIADSGVAFNTKWADNLKTSFAISNGEGLLFSQDASSLLRWSGLVDFSPIKSLQLSVYGDAMPSANMGTQTTVALFAGTTLDMGRASVELFQQSSQKNASGSDVTGLSIFALYKGFSPFDIFARFDSQSSKNDFSSKDGSVIIAGVQYPLIKTVRASLFFQADTPRSGKASSQVVLATEATF